MALGPLAGNQAGDCVLSAQSDSSDVSDVSDVSDETRPAPENEALRTKH